MTRAQRRVGTAWFTWFTLAWLVLWAIQLTPVQLLIPLQLDSPDDADGWVRGVVTAGLVLAVGGAAGLVAGPLAGAWSDRTTSPLGRRRPWALAGTWIGAVSLVGTAFADRPVPVALGWIGVSVGVAVSSSALTAMIADQLEDQRGAASAAIGSAQAIGVIVGVAAVTLLGLDVTGGYLLLAALVALVGTVTSLLLPDPRPEAAALESAPVETSTVSGVPFRWLWTGRLVVNVGNALGTGLLFFFLLYGLDRDPDHAEDDLLLLIVVYTVFVVVASVAAGSWSDRTGRRHGLVVASAVVQAAAGVVLAVAPSYAAGFVAAALIGTGYGAFMTVGLALGTDLLPADVDHARDLGLLNVSANLGQLLGPLVGAGLVAASGGFTLVFMTSAVLSVAGGLMTRGVRVPRE